MEVCERVGTSRMILGVVESPPQLPELPGVCVCVCVCVCAHNIMCV